MPFVKYSSNPDQSLSRSRRNFPLIAAEGAAIFRERNRIAFIDEPLLADLEKRLLAFGGLIAILDQPEHDIEALMERGRCFPRVSARNCLGIKSACHSNVSALFALTDGMARIATGYALSSDGLWRQHSWGVDARDGYVVETTVRRHRYYGFVLDEAEVLLILGAHTSHSTILSRRPSNALCSASPGSRTLSRAHWIFSSESWLWLRNRTARYGFQLGAAGG